MAFYVETMDKNPLWRIFNITGEQLYNWGLRRGALVAFGSTWGTSYLQYWALQFDALMGRILINFGIEFGGEAGKICSRVWSDHRPDMVPSPSSLRTVPPFSHFLSPKPVRFFFTPPARPRLTRSPLD